MGLLSLPILRRWLGRGGWWIDFTALYDVFVQTIMHVVVVIFYLLILPAFFARDASHFCQLRAFLDDILFFGLVLRFIISEV